MDFPVSLPSQLSAHLRSLRKSRGLTQAALGQLMGLGQARIAEIENKPGVVGIEQLMRLLSTLKVSLVLRDEIAVDGARDLTTPPLRHTVLKQVHSQDLSQDPSQSPNPAFAPLKKGSW